MEITQNLIDFELWGNTGQDYLYAIGVFFAFIVVLKILQVVFLRRLQKAADKTATELDDVFIQIVKKIRPPFYFVVALYLAFLFLSVPENWANIVKGLFIVIIIYQITHSVQIFIDYWISKLAIKEKESKDQEKKEALIKGIGHLVKIALWTVAALVILSNLGFNVTSLVAGLGVTGIIIGLALQNILADIFSSFSILFDKPFQIGDFISVGKDSGTVEKIGIKSTRIKSIGGQEVIISNKELTTARVNNFRRMKKRRVSFLLGVTYETPNSKLKKIPEILKGVIEKVELAEFSRTHFKKYGDFSLDFEVVYSVTVKDYAKYMDTQQEINFALKEEFEKEQIEFAYPTQTLFVRK